MAPKKESIKKTSITVGGVPLEGEILYTIVKAF